LGVGGVEGGGWPVDLRAGGGVDGDADCSSGAPLLFGDVVADGLCLLFEGFDLLPGVFELPGQPLLKGAEFVEAVDDDSSVTCSILGWVACTANPRAKETA